MKIESSDISVIVQGPIYPNFTFKCLKSIRTVLPKAEIILSTWEGSDTSGLLYDKLALSDDPGPTISDQINNAENNINRQLVSTQAGLRLAKRKYAMKFRSDMELLDDSFLNYFDVYDDLTSAEFFRKRLLVCNYFSRNARIVPLAYHVTDWFAFGLLEDISGYYSAPLQSEEEAHWFAANEKKDGLYSTYECRYTPEQYICINFLRSKKDIHCDCFYDCNDNAIVDTEKVIANNFVILDYGKQFKAKFLKYNPDRYLEKFTLLSYRKWLILYNTYSCHKKSPFIIFFLMSCKIWRMVYVLRQQLIRFMILTHTKERVKILMTRVGNLFRGGV